MRPQVSFSEMSARERAHSLFDPETSRELLGPFERIESPHLQVQGIVPQSDDGVVIVRGHIAGTEAVAISIEGGFQGGSIGEVNGAKIAGALELALRDVRSGRLVRPVILFETGGIRVQEANLGILAISEIHAAILALREHIPVVGVIAGKIGCFGGMGIAAGLCSILIGAEVGRLGLNGPEVIELEAGLAELDARNRPRIWQTIGCKRRLETGHIDQLVDDSVDAVSSAIRSAFASPANSHSFRSRDISAESERVQRYSINEPPKIARDLPISLGRAWLEALNADKAQQWQIPSVIYADAQWDTESVRMICVTPNPNARFPRARRGQFGIEEGWAVAGCIQDAMLADSGHDAAHIRRAILAIVDVPGQAFGFQEESLALHQSLAASVDAYATARSAGHPVIALVVGKAISGAFLAHGLQAGYIFALDDPGVEIHVMSAASVARVTKRTEQEVTELESRLPAISRNVHSFAALGGIDHLLGCKSADAPDSETIASIRRQLQLGFAQLRQTPRQPRDRLNAVAARESRVMSRIVRAKLEVQWH